MLSAGAIVELTAERPVVGGRMLARVEGEIVLVEGAIPGERARVKVDRRQQGVWLARVVDVLVPSAERCDPGPDPACGGMAFAHIRYARQCELKAAIVADAMDRIGKIVLDGPVRVTPSPAEGYRSRFRVHPRNGRLGFFREATHDICDPAASGQLTAQSVACLRALETLVTALEEADVDALEFVENMANTERVVNVAMRGGRPSAGLLAAVASVGGVTGVSWTEGRSRRLSAGSGQCWVTDRVGDVLGRTEMASGPSADATLRRHAPAFFQANRFLVGPLARVVFAWLGDGAVVDLYAGVGLFAVCRAAAGRGRTLAIESDPMSVADLRWNARPFSGLLTVEASTVEAYCSRAPHLRDASLIVDPPRVGISRVALSGIVSASAQRIVYVSCDVATLARDARRLVDAGYRLVHVEALDMFPNTAHVEVVAVFVRAD